MTVVGSPIPNPGVYKEKQAYAEQAYQKALASINQRRQQLSSQYGFQYDTNQQGGISNYRIDPTNQYGLAQRMLYQQGSELGQAEQGAASRGFYGSGLGQQGESRLRYGHGLQSKQLGEGFLSGFQGLAQEQTGALDERNRLYYEAEAQARQEAIQNQWWQEYIQSMQGQGAGSDGGGGGGSTQQLPLVNALPQAGGQTVTAPGIAEHVISNPGILTDEELLALLGNQPTPQQQLAAALSGGGGGNVRYQ